MFFEDLALCRYHTGPFDADSWHVPLRAIGWLEGGHSFRCGESPPGLVAQLGSLIDNAGSIFRQHNFRGLHDCTLCAPGEDARLAGSHVNLLIPSIRTVFACPAAITHYLTVHNYLPPVEFVDAVFRCSPYGSPKYLESLREANDGYSIPLVTWDEYLTESRKELEEIIRLRQARLDSEPKS
jgi:hypothetical protein